MKIGQWIGLFVLLTSLYILWQIRQIVLLLLTAVVLATALNKLVKQFQRFHLPRAGAVLLSISLLILFLGTFFLVAVPPLVAQFQDLIALIPQGLNQIQTWIFSLEQRFPLLLPVLPDTRTLIAEAQPLVMQMLRESINFFSASVNAFFSFLLILVLTIMLLVNPSPYRKTFIRLFPSFYRYRVDYILDRCQVGLEHWIVGALIEMLFVGALSGIGLLLLQVPLVLAHAVLAGLLNFIPNIGPTLSVFLPMSVALVDAPWKALAVFVLYIVIQQVESYWLTPLVMAKQVALLPAVTLTAQIFFASFFGALGLLMALPLTVIAKTWLEESLFKDVLDNWRDAPSYREESLP